jgi:hypothetical protein
MVIDANIEVKGQCPKFDTFVKKFLLPMATPKNGFAIAGMPNLHIQSVF